MTASKQKGTSGETELRKKMLAYGIELRRTAASSRYDLYREGYPAAVEALATRPDHGQWLVTVDLETFVTLLNAFDREGVSLGHGVSELNIEVKRYARFLHHRMYESKFPKGGTA